MNTDKQLGKIFSYFAMITIALMLFYHFYYYYFYDGMSDIINTEIVGIVDDKYVVEMDHGATYLKINNRDVDIMFFSGNFIRNVQIGDSVYSKTGDTLVKIIRNDSVMEFQKVSEKIIRKYKKNE